MRIVAIAALAVPIQHAAKFIVRRVRVIRWRGCGVRIKRTRRRVIRRDIRIRKLRLNVRACAGSVVARKTDIALRRAEREQVAIFAGVLPMTTRALVCKIRVRTVRTCACRRARERCARVRVRINPRILRLRELRRRRRTHFDLRDFAGQFARVIAQSKIVRGRVRGVHRRA